MKTILNEKEVFEKYKEVWKEMDLKALCNHLEYAVLLNEYRRLKGDWTVDKAEIIYKKLHKKKIGFHIKMLVGLNVFFMIVFLAGAGMFINDFVVDLHALPVGVLVILFLASAFCFIIVYYTWKEIKFLIKNKYKDVSNI